MSNPLENYLIQYRVQLKAMPHNEREAEVEEARQHLTALIEQRIEAGESPESATFAAIRQFGSPQQNGKALRDAWKAGRSGKRERFITGTHRLLAVVLIFPALLNLLLYLFMRLDFRWGVHVLANIEAFPHLFDHWGGFGTWAWWPVLASYAWFVAFAALSLAFAALSLAFAALSLAFAREMRTAFFLMFAVLDSSNVAMQIAHFARPSFFYVVHPYIDFAYKLTLLLISGFCLVTELSRNNSLISPSSPIAGKSR